MVWCPPGNRHDGKLRQLPGHVYKYKPPQLPAAYHSSPNASSSCLLQQGRSAASKTPLQADASQGNTTFLALPVNKGTDGGQQCRMIPAACAAQAGTLAWTPGLSYTHMGTCSQQQHPTAAYEHTGTHVLHAAPPTTMPPAPLAHPNTTRCSNTPTLYVRTPIHTTQPPAHYLHGMTHPTCYRVRMQHQNPCMAGCQASCTQASTGVLQHHKRPHQAVATSRER
jgi:hypothetical protein